MAIPSKSERFKQFIKKLKAHQPVTNREDAVSLMKRLMKEVEDYHQLTDHHAIRMNVFSISPTMGWENIGSDPCYWDDFMTKTHRTFVYNSGRIVIKNIKAGSDIVVLDKPGA